MDIANHTFFITGGSSGLGKATAWHLAEQNANVVIADVNAEKGNQLSSELNERALFIQMDVTDSDSIEAALLQTVQQFGGIHGLVNCAGILAAERMLKKDGSLFDPEVFRRCIEINLIGTFNTMRLASPVMAENRPNDENERGIIVNTASIAAFEGQIGQAAYSASKAGIVAMTLPIARELGKQGIRVMAIAPGVFETPLFEDINEKIRNDLKSRTPFPSRLGHPVEFANLVGHIIENPMLNGEVIRLDGALRM